MWGALPELALWSGNLMGNNWLGPHVVERKSFDKTHEYKKLSFIEKGVSNHH